MLIGLYLLETVKTRQLNASALRGVKFLCLNRNLILDNMCSKKTNIKTVLTKAKVKRRQLDDK